jgi:hypothetical protein
MRHVGKWPNAIFAATLFEGNEPAAAKGAT